MNEAMRGDGVENTEGADNSKRYEYIDKNGQPHFFETSEQLMDFREEENRKENN